MKKFITTLSLLCVFLLLGCSIVEKDAAIDPAWAKLASNNSYFDGRNYFNNDASIFTITDGSKSYTFEHVESTPTSATYTDTYKGVDISYSFSGVDIFKGTVVGTSLSGPFEWDNNPLLGGAFIISDDDLYMFSSDGKELTNRVYNTSSKEFTDTVFTYAGNNSYSNTDDEIEITAVTTDGGKINDIDFSFLPFTLGTVDDTLKNATKHENFYSDSMRLDYDEDSYFISDSDVEVYSQKDENNKNLELEKYIANYVTNANITFDPAKDIKISIDRNIDPTGTIITKANAIITGDNADNKVKVTANGCIVVGSEVEGSIIVNGNVSGNYNSIFVFSSVGGSIIVNGSVTASGSYGTGIFVELSATISGSIIVNGSVTASGSYGTGIRVDSTVGGSIIVSGTVSSFYDENGKSITYTDVTSIYRYTYLTPDMSDDISAMVFSGTRESDKAPASVVEPIYLPSIK